MLGKFHVRLCMVISATDKKGTGIILGIISHISHKTYFVTHH